MTMTRQGFVRLMLVATGTAAFTAACGDDGTGGSGAAGGSSGGSGGSGASGGNPSTGGTGPSTTTSTTTTSTTSGGNLTCTPTISFNHSHELMIPAADLDSAADKTYDIMGASPHGHSVTFTGTQLASLKAGDTVMVTSTAGGMDQHTHNVSVSCS